MLLHIIAVLIYLGVAFLIVRSVLKKQNSLTLKKRAFVLTLLSGAFPCTVCIIIFELLFDRFIFQSTGSLGGEILTSFFRAALIEEAFKLIFCRIAIKKHMPSTKIEYILLCGMIGAGYGIVEKLAYGGGVILIVNAFLPLHIFFQFLMGALLYEKRGILTFLLPFLVHGLWDSLLAIAGWLLEQEGRALPEVLGLVMFAGLIAGGLIAELKILKKLKVPSAEQSSVPPSEAE